MTTVSEHPPHALDTWRPVVAPLTELYALPLSLLMAQLWTESSGDQWASRYEPNWRYFWLNGPLYTEQVSVEENRRLALQKIGALEFHFQSMSLGLLQIMGAVAREQGHRGSLAQLYDPTMNVHYACRIMRRHLITTQGDEREALKRYNGSFTYSDKVLRRQAILNELR